MDFRHHSNVPRPSPPRPYALHSSPGPFPLFRQPQCCRLRGLPPQWLYEVRPATSTTRCPPGANPPAAKPASALLPYRAGSVAFLSNTSSNNATTMKPGLVSGNPGTPPPTKQARQEVPLPSQEGKKGAMQYAL